MSVFWITVNIGIIFVIASVVPFEQYRIQQIEAQYFKRIKIKRFPMLFRAIGGASVKKQGLIVPLFIAHLAGYLLALISLIVSSIFLIKYGLNIIINVTLLNFAILFFDCICSIALNIILTIVSMKRKRQLQQPPFL